MSATDSPTTTARTLRLMIGEIDWADAHRVRAFVRLGSERLQHAWTVVSDGAVNVLLTELDCPPTIPGDPDEPVVHVRVWRQDRQVGMPPGVLRSPLQFDDFITALAAAESSLAARGRAAKPQPARSAAADAPQPALEGQLFRLRRWPPAALLAQSRYGIRLASFLSARSVSLDELVLLSNVERAECARLIRVLLAQAMLRVEQAGAASAVLATPQPAARDSVFAAAPVTRLPPRERGSTERLGLLAALRRRLGLALGR